MKLSYRPHCIQCMARYTRPGDCFCSDECGWAYSLGLLIHHQWCARCQGWFLDALHMEHVHGETQKVQDQ
jgi:hypothetical protein